MTTPPNAPLRPLKPYLPGYRAIEDKVMAAICKRFGIEPTMPP